MRRGSRLGCYNLGTVYAQGTGVSRDAVKAEFCRRRATAVAGELAATVQRSSSTSLVQRRGTV